MTISKTQNGTSLEIRLGGRLDTTSAPELQAELDGSLAGVEQLTLDLADLVYISSVGLRVLLSTRKRMSGQGKMTVKNVGQAVMEIFEVTGFSDILNIE